MTRRPRDRRPDERCFRFDLSFPKLGIDRVNNSAETRSYDEYQHRKAILKKLAHDGQDEVLRAFQSGQLGMALLVKADREGDLEGPKLLAVLRMRQPLFPTTGREAMLERMARGRTGERYGQSLDALKRKGARWLKPDATIADLQRVDWVQLHNDWNAGPSDWNHLRRAVSRLLSVTLGHKWHPTRLEIIAKIPLGAEEERTSDLTVEQFIDVMNAVPDHARPAYMALVLTGFRYAEYAACKKEHLRPATTTVLPPHAKTKKGRKPVQIAETMWPWIEAGIPAPLGYSWLRKYLVRACLKLGLATKVPNLVKDPTGTKKYYQGPRIHDLRHLHGQLIVDSGLPEWMAQRSLRHATPAMTRRYVERSATGKAADAIAASLEGKGSSSLKRQA
jgi:integrase